MIFLVILWKSPSSTTLFIVKERWRRGFTNCEGVEMKVIFIPHALDRMKKRGITEKMVLQTLKDPEKVVESYRGRKATQKMFNDKLLGVIYEEEENCLKVITAYLTSKVDKYR